MVRPWEGHQLGVIVCIFVLYPIKNRHVNKCAGSDHKDLLRSLGVAT